MRVCFVEGHGAGEADEREEGERLCFRVVPETDRVDGRPRSGVDGIFCEDEGVWGEALRLCEKACEFINDTDICIQPGYVHR